MNEPIKFPVERTRQEPHNKGKRKQFLVERDPESAARTLAQYFGPRDLVILIHRLGEHLPNNVPPGDVI